MLDNLPQRVATTMLQGERDRAHEHIDVLTHQRDILAEDLETALNLCRSYQNAMVMLGANDPNWVKLRALLVKYRMPYTNPEGHTTGQVFADGKDITVHPDSIEATAEEDGQIEGQMDIFELTDGITIIDDDDGDPC